MGNSKNSSGIVVAAFTGALIGSAVAVLYAPRSGKATRIIIKKDIENTSSRLNHAALNLKGNIIRNLQQHGDGVGYIVGSLIARNAVTIKEVIEALGKELDALRTENDT